MIPRKRALPFGARFALIYSTVFAVIFAGTGLFLSRSSEKQALQVLEDSLLLQARQLTQVFRPVLAEGDVAKLHGLSRRFGRGEKVRITVMDEDGRVLGDSRRSREEMQAMENHANRPEVRRALQGSPAVEVHESRTLRIVMLYVAVPLMVEGGIEGVLRLAIPLSQVEPLMESMRRPFLYGTGLGILLIFLLGLLLGRPLSDRISMLTRMAIRYAGGDLSRRITLSGEDELNVLADAMNKMADSLKTRMQEIENERGNLSVILTAMAEGVIAVDHERRILLLNPSAERMFPAGPPGEERTLLSVTRKPRLIELLDDAEKGGRPAVAEIELTHPLERTLRVSVMAVPEQAGNRVSGILVFTDISKLRRLENMRREFVANVSHELRTPLTSLRGFIETLQGGADSEADVRERFLSMMKEDALRLERLIEDLLDLSRMEAGEVRLNFQTVDLAEEVGHVAERFKARLEERKLHFINETLPVRVQADRDKIRQVLINLLDNAVKFNREGGEIRVTAAAHKEKVTVTVRDSGPGIPEAVQARLFERFFRVDRARSRELGGTGLGLSIVKHIVELHGGSVGCRSRAGEGAAFYFTLPAGGG